MPSVVTLLTCAEKRILRLCRHIRGTFSTGLSPGSSFAGQVQHQRQTVQPYSIVLTPGSMLIGRTWASRSERRRDGYAWIIRSTEMVDELKMAVLASQKPLPYLGCNFREWKRQGYDADRQDVTSLPRHCQSPASKGPYNSRYPVQPLV